MDELTWTVEIVFSEDEDKTSGCPADRRSGGVAGLGPIASQPTIPTCPPSARRSPPPGR